MENTVSNKVSLAVALLILLMSIALLVTAYDYRGGSGVFPRFIGWIFLVLTLAECVIQAKRLFSGKAPSADPESVNGLGPDIKKELRGFFWIAFFLASLYIGGFLVGIPLYIFAFLRLSAGRSYRQCIIMSVSATVFVYVLFIQLLEYRLYHGLFF